MKVTRALVLALVLGSVGYGWLLLAPASASGPFGDLVVVPLLLALPLVVLMREQRDAAGVRPWLLPLSAGMALFTLGHLASAVERYVAPGGEGHLGDIVTMVGYPFLLGGLLAATAQHVRGLRLTMCLDGVAGALAGAALAALAVTPLLPSLAGRQWSTVVPLAYPIVDGVLVSAALGGLALVGARHGRRFGLWVLGLAGLSLAHLLEAHQVAVGATVDPLDTAVVVVPALALLAVGALGPGAVSVPGVPGARSLGVPALASSAAVAVLAAAPAWDVSAVPSLLALAALVVCGVRFLRAFLQLRELAEVRELALTDELTGIANRRALYVHLDALLALHEPDGAHDGSEPPASFAVALIDLDHFKEVNDTLGHATGDALLKGVVGRFAAALEELDTPHLLARLGGDEFAVVLHEATSRNAALIVGQALQEALAEPLELPGTALHAGASIGLAVAPVHGRTRSEILFAADAAMYAAKTSGDAVRFHAPARDEKTQQLTLAEDLHRALVRHELCVEYQAIVTGEDDLVGVEALVRWDHPERGMLLPADFLPAAERYRLTGAVAQRVLDVALDDLSRWRADGATLGVTVNLSATDLRDESIVRVVAEALLAHRLPADVLTLDVSETALDRDDERPTEVVRALHELGVHLALDDYGTGGTSLTQLHELPFGTIKLGGRFARDTAVDARATGVVRAIVDLAHALGRTIVAEGVEDRRALVRLLEVGCDLVQGWYVGAPGSALAVEALIARKSDPDDGRHRFAVPEQQSRGGDAQVTPA
ncbi:MAG TPA: EAL domain-containing protein [Nocardioides sp.]|uniref:putative bifunctional diguanylate cyclase/phosphodiesterase n=1 Tax=Nocardioides sp. TaxID=35761 RepID=UPI002D80A4E9|nr:EAL domain-containing protein [Nocardioides sp.]HET6651910.1 EAL domain-containing protein [Nocardioides sp.]